VLRMACPTQLDGNTGLIEVAVNLFMVILSAQPAQSSLFPPAV
jgi:hypothetical protein